jgi:hypothetical protein
MKAFSLVLIFLKSALRQPGCPLCRARLSAETRYLKSLLWEHVNDAGTRIRLTQSLGACGRHAQQMLQMEVTGWDVPLGNAIIYEGLAKTVSFRLREVRALAKKQARRGNAQRLMARLAARGKRDERLDRPLTPEKGCRVCELGQESERYYAETLLQMLDEQEYQRLYDGSDGVCLSHLRLLLQISSPGAGLQYLLDQSEQRTERLETDLREYVRKQSYQFHDEPVSEGERTAAARAKAFFGGLEAATSMSIDQKYEEAVSIGDPGIYKDW